MYRKEFDEFIVDGGGEAVFMQGTSGRFCIRKRRYFQKKRRFAKSGGQLNAECWHKVLDCAVDPRRHSKWSKFGWKIQQKKKIRYGTLRRNEGDRNQAQQVETGLCRDRKVGRHQERGQASSALKERLANHETQS